MIRTQTIFTVIFFALAYTAVPPTAHAQEKSDREAAAEDKAEDKGTVKLTPAEEEPAEKIVPITIGSPAPQLDIEHWIQDGEGHFAKLSEFEPGKVYVVEFWATWCGPCIAAMPHVAQLQRSYADRGVQVVSITREDVETVEKFLDREVRGSRTTKSGADDSEDGDQEARPQTYRELTSGYCLTADPDQSSSRDYMQAAKRTGIPCAFIVGKDAKIEWIGHPMAMDEPLEKIVTDAWDRDAFAVEYAAEQEASQKFSEFATLMRAKKTDEALAVLDDYIANGKLDREKAKYRSVKFQVLASDKNRADQASAYALELLADESMDASAVNNLTWTIYRLAEMERMQDEQVLQTALSVAEKAVDNAGAQKAFLLDTVAHLQYATGDRASALETQRSAIEAADPGTRGRMTGFLQKLEKEIKADQEAAEKEKDGAEDSKDTEKSPEENADA